MASRFVVVPTFAIIDPTLTVGAFKTLCMLSTFADADGWCWPSHARLAADLLMSRQTVARHLRDLEAEFYIESSRRTRPSDGGETSKLYRLLYDRRDSASVDTPLGNESATPLPTGDTPPVPPVLHQEVDPKELDPKNPKQIIDEPFIGEMITKYAGNFTEPEVREHIADALNHKNRKKWDDQRRYVDGWLRRAVDWSVKRGTSAGRGNVAGGGGYTGNRGGAVGSVRGGGDSVVRGAFPVARQWPPPGNE